ncbi:MAG TPA: hypothetical protein VMH84_12440 [Xanthobacteraceae bacterium]|nr:hypothetical protein [Xanthobacteraceae bacterium]
MIAEYAKGKRLDWLLGVQVWARCRGGDQDEGRGERFDGEARH